MDVDPGWQLVRICFEGQQIDVAGANLWQVEWASTGERITVASAVPAQRHVMSVYEVADSDPAVRFAAGEFSNGVWGFYVPAQ